MKKLILKTPAFRYLEKSYGEWLDILGYAPSTVRYFPTYIREFLHYMEKHGYTQINQIDIPLIRKYYKELSQRPACRPGRANQRQGGGLSNNYLNTHLNAIDRLLEYLRKQARIEIPQTGIPKETPNPEEVIPLTLEQVKKLYEAADTCAEDQETNYPRVDRPAIRLRDKAILAVFYDCGLRRTEGESLNLSDIHYDNRLLEVRKGKGGKPRFVPMSLSTVAHLQNYQYEGRPLLIKSATEEAFFLNYRGNRASGSLFNHRLKELQKYNDDAQLRQMNLHLHILRHSIATHLLYQGMSLEKVAQFLGHYSLESTQIYIEYLQKKGSSKSSIAVYIHCCKKFIEWAESRHIEIEYVTYSELLDYVASLKKRVTQRTIQNYMIAIAHYFEALVQAEIILQNPAKYLDLKAPTNRKLYAILTREQLENLYNNFDITATKKTRPTAKASAIRSKIAIGLMVFQGLDSTALSKLRVQDVDVLGGKITVNSSRSHAARNLALQAVQIIELDRYINQTRKELQHHFKKEDNDLLLITGYKHFNESLRRLTKRLRKQEPQLQSLLRHIRASVITHWLRQYNLREVQYMAGHRKILSTELYQQNDIEGLQADIDRFHPMNEQK